MLQNFHSYFYFMQKIALVLLLLCLSCKNNDPSEKPVEDRMKSSAEVDLKVYTFEEFEGFLHKDDGRVYVINFWATWCAPCVKELPHFEQLNAKYADKNVKIILVSLDFPNQYDSKLKPYIRSKDIKSQVIALNDPDSNSWIPKVDQNWTGAIPATLIYSDQQRVFYEQPFDYEQLETALKPFLKP